MTEHKEVVESIGKKMGFKPNILETLGELDPEFLGKFSQLPAGTAHSRCPADRRTRPSRARLWEHSLAGTR